MNGDERPDLRVVARGPDYRQMWEEDTARLKGQLANIAFELMEKDKALKIAHEAARVSPARVSPETRAQALGFALTYFTIHGVKPESAHALILVAEPLRAFLDGDPEPARAEVVTSVDDE
jgi:hypothetical protein